MQPWYNKSLKNQKHSQLIMTNFLVFLLVIIAYLSVLNLANAGNYFGDLQCTFDVRNLKCLKDDDCLDKCLELYDKKLIAAACIGDPAKTEPNCVCGYRCHRKKFI